MKVEGEVLLKYLLSELQFELPSAVTLRHEIHASPCIGGTETPTAKLVADALDVSDAPWVTEGRIVRIDIGSGPAVAIRAELDALPITELTDVEWHSTNGAMHACGHDIHLAALVAVARTIRRVGTGTPLVAVLQPREESVPCGAKDMVESPILAQQSIGAFIGVHVQPSLPRGVVAAQSGPVNAASDEFRITVRGRAGHGAYPHRTQDSVAAAAAIVVALNQITSRRLDPMHPSVITIGSIAGGSAPNAIAADALLTGTIRCFDEADRKELWRLVRSAAELTAQVHGCTAEVAFLLGDPVLVNDRLLADAIGPLLASEGIDANGDHRSCGADDFAYYSKPYPSLMCFVGVDSPPGVDLHHPQFLPSDQAMVDVATTMLAGYVAAAQVLADQPEGNRDD